MLVTLKTDTAGQLLGMGQCAAGGDTCIVFRLRVLREVGAGACGEVLLPELRSDRRVCAAVKRV